VAKFFEQLGVGHRPLRAALRKQPRISFGPRDGQITADGDCLAGHQIASVLQDNKSFFLTSNLIAGYPDSREVLVRVRGVAGCG
jgi:hypothetical protein